MGEEFVAILDFGSQYAQLIARRVREQHVYCEILPCDIPADRLPPPAHPRSPARPPRAEGDHPVRGTGERL